MVTTLSKRIFFVVNLFSHARVNILHVLAFLLINSSIENDTLHFTMKSDSKRVQQQGEERKRKKQRKMGKTSKEEAAISTKSKKKKNKGKEEQRKESKRQKEGRTG